MLSDHNYGGWSREDEHEGQYNTSEPFDENDESSLNMSPRLGLTTLKQELGRSRPEEMAQHKMKPLSRSQEILENINTSPPALTTTPPNMLWFKKEQPTPALPLSVLQAPEIKSHLLS